MTLIDLENQFSHCIPLYIQYHGKHIILRLLLATALEATSVHPMGKKDRKGRREMETGRGEKRE